MTLYRAALLVGFSVCVVGFVVALVELVRLRRAQHMKFTDERKAMMLDTERRQDYER